MRRYILYLINQRTLPPPQLRLLHLIHCRSSIVPSSEAAGGTKYASSRTILASTIEQGHNGCERHPSTADRRAVTRPRVRENF